MYITTSGISGDLDNKQQIPLSTEIHSLKGLYMPILGSSTTTSVLLEGNAGSSRLVEDNIARYPSGVKAEMKKR